MDRIHGRLPDHTLVEGVEGDKLVREATPCANSFDRVPAAETTYRT